MGHASASEVRVVSWYRAALVLITTICVWAILSLALSTPRTIEILFAPAVVTDQDSIAIEVWVTAKPEHRRLVIMACGAGGGCVRRSDITLDGAEAAQVYRIEWRSGLPAGDLWLIASVHSQARELARASRPITVISTHG